MTISIILFSAVILVLSIIMVASDDKVDRLISSVYLMICILCLCAFVFLKTEKTTSIKHINGKRIYEKQYIINSDGVKVDSIYVIIKQSDK